MAAETNSAAVSVFSSRSSAECPGSMLAGVFLRSVPAMRCWFVGMGRRLVRHFVEREIAQSENEYFSKSSLVMAPEL